MAKPLSHDRSHIIMVFIGVLNYCSYFYSWSLYFSPGSSNSPLKGSLGKVRESVGMAVGEGGGGGRGRGGRGRGDFGEGEFGDGGEGECGDGGEGECGYGGEGSVGIVGIPPKSISPLIIHSVLTLFLGEHAPRLP